MGIYYPEIIVQFQQSAQIPQHLRLFPDFLSSYDLLMKQVNFPGRLLSGVPRTHVAHNHRVMECLDACSATTLRSIVAC